MALLASRLGLLFLMTPHTGCTAIGLALRRKFGATFVPPEDILNADGSIRIDRKHTLLRELLDEGLVTAEQRRSLLVAAGVRNPYDVLVSAFMGAGLPGGAAATGKRIPPGSAAAAAGIQITPEMFERWLRTRFGRRLLPRLRGHRWRHPIDHAEGADVLIRFERLQEDFDALMSRLGVQDQVLVPRANPTRLRDNVPYQRFYTPASVRLVADIFADELTRYGYRFEPLATETTAGV